jgi:hypothetical protein
MPKEEKENKDEKCGIMEESTVYFNARIAGVC